MTEVHNLEEIQKLREQIQYAARRTYRTLNNLGSDPMGALYKLKFSRAGYDPFGVSSDNFVEQLHQTFTMMATLAAARRLLQDFPELESGGLHLNLGNTSGIDIKSKDSNALAAEVFAQVSPDNNGKLGKEVRKLCGRNFNHRFVFFYSPHYEPKRQKRLEKRYFPEDENPKVQIWALDKSEIM